jgi:GntR family transcriptional regulator
MAEIPLYQIVYQQLRQRVAMGTYLPGGKLPSESQLGSEFGVSRITVRRSIHELTLDGLVINRHGIGNIVRDRPRNVEIGMANFTSEVAAGRLRLVRTLLEDSTVAAADQVAGKLGLQPGSLTRHLVRLDLEGGAPLSVDEAFIPLSIAGDITPEIGSSPLFMHEWQVASKLHFVHSQFEISVQEPDAFHQRVLQIGAGVPVLVSGELVFDINDRPCLWIVSRYRGDRSSLYGTATLVQKETKAGMVGE